MLAQKLNMRSLKPGLEINSLAWEVVNPQPIIDLPVGVPVYLNFTVEAKEFEPDIFLEALLGLH